MMHKHHISNLDQLIRIALIAALVFWSLKLLLPLFGVLAWGFILAVALYPIHSWLSRQFGGRSTLAAIFITFFSLLLVVGSLVLLTNNMISTVSDITQKARVNEFTIPQPPIFIKNWPVIGEQLHDAWSLASVNIGTTLNKYASYLLEIGKFLLNKTAILSFDFILFIIAVLFSGYLLSISDRLTLSISKLAERISPERGMAIINIMKDTIQNVSRGVIGLSLFQALLLGLLLLIGDTPGAGIISMLALIMGIAQLSLILLVAPIMIWLFIVKSFIFALSLSIALSMVALMDNFLKPYILARGLRTPMLVIFIGVIGGVISHGIIGIFIGPVVLAIFYELVNQWLLDD